MLVPSELYAETISLLYCRPKDLPEPYANRQPTQPGGLLGGGSGGGMSNPAQMISNAISNGTLRFDAAGDDEMDSDSDNDQYHKSPGQIGEDDGAMTEDVSSSSAASSDDKDGSSKAASVLESSATPSKLAPGPDSPFSQDGPAQGSLLSPPSAVMGVQSNSPAAKSESLPDQSEQP